MRPLANLGAGIHHQDLGSATDYNSTVEGLLKWDQALSAHKLVS
jgi:hypothetical protein